MPARLRPQVRRPLPGPGRRPSDHGHDEVTSWPTGCAAARGILELLRTHADDQAHERENAAQLWLDEGWIFATETGAPINPRSDWDAWKRLLVEAGVRDGRLHDARHTAATVLLLLGVHERAIMSILGWSSTAMVSRYAHVVAPIHGEVATRLDGLFWSSSHPQDGSDGDRRRAHP